MDTENTLTGALEFRSGFHATMAMTSDSRFPGDNNAFEVYGTSGVLYLGDPNLFNDKIYYRRMGCPDKMEFPITHPYGNGSFRGIGAAEMAWAMRTNRPHRLAAELGLHALEVQRGILDSGKDGVFRTMHTDFERPVPISADFYGGTANERNLYLYEDPEK